MATEIIGWTHKWNKKMGGEPFNSPLSIRAVYLDPECNGRDKYDVESDGEVNAISIYKWNEKAGGDDCIADIHDVAVAQEILTGYLNNKIGANNE